MSILVSAGPPVPRRLLCLMNGICSVLNNEKGESCEPSMAAGSPLPYNLLILHGWDVLRKKRKGADGTFKGIDYSHRCQVWLKTQDQGLPGWAGPLLSP